MVHSSVRSHIHGRLAAFSMLLTIAFIGAPSWAQEEDATAAYPDEEAPPPVHDPVAETTESDSRARREAREERARSRDVDEEDVDEERYEEGPRVRKPMAQNGIFLELLGPGVFYSLNYERIWGDIISTRVGASAIVINVSNSDGNSTGVFATFPMTVSFVGVRSGKHGFEGGAGMTLIYASAGTSTITGSTNSNAVGVMPNIFAGYRMHPVEFAGFQLRAGVAVVASIFNGMASTFPWPYLSVGAGF